MTCADLAEVLIFLRRCLARFNLQRLYLLAHLQRNVKGAATTLQQRVHCHVGPMSYLAHQASKEKLTAVWLAKNLQPTKKNWLLAFLYFCNPSGQLNAKVMRANVLNCLAKLLKTHTYTYSCRTKNLPPTFAVTIPQCLFGHENIWQQQFTGSKFFETKITTTDFRQGASPTTPALVTKTSSKFSRLDRKNSKRHQTPQLRKSHSLLRKGNRI